MIPVLILAAGASSRMGGRDKLMEDVGGVPLLRRQIDIAAGVGAVYVALPAADHPRMAALVGTRASPLIAQNAADGMGATLRDAVAQLPVCGAFMVLLGDLISLEKSVLNCNLSLFINKRHNTIVTHKIEFNIFFFIIVILLMLFLIKSIIKEFNIII